MIKGTHSNLLRQERTIHLKLGFGATSRLQEKPIWSYFN
jgi:hypothetical protein